MWEGDMRKYGLAALLLCALSGPAFAGYPDRPIRFIVPQAAGSNTDLYSRLIAAEMSKTLGQQLVIENKPGAAFVVGLDAIAKAPPDGYTIGMGLIGGLAIAPHMVAKLPYDIEKDFQPVAQVSRAYMILAISPKSQLNSVKDILDYAKANPGKLSNASSATGSPGHVGAELFKSMAGVKITHVPYRGGAGAVNDLLAGHVDIMLEGLQSMAPHVREGRVKAVGVSGATRSQAFPDIPTLAEAGVPGYEATTWLGVVAPAGTPRDIVTKLNKAVNEALKAPPVAAQFKLNGDEAVGGTPEAYGKLIKSDNAKWKDVVAQSGARLE
jgi:tripartite-type tricarboxylate transporter receptor subunit TctC